MKPLTEHIKAVRMQPFPYRVNVILTNSLSRSVAARESVLGKQHSTEMAYALHFEVTNTSFIFLPLKCSPGTIAHEAYHAIVAMAKYVGSEMDEEMVAYHMGYLVEAIHKLGKKAA